MPTRGAMIGADGESGIVHAWDPCDYARHSATQERWARDCLERLRLRGDERVLDIGCGDGRVSARFAARLPRGSLLGVDASPEMIAHARQTHTGERSPNLDFAIADAAHLDFRARFDLVVSFNCLHWVLDQRAVLAGIARALVPGGHLLLHFGGHGNVAGMWAVVEEVIGREAWRESFAGMGFPWCFPDVGEYRRLMVEAGLAPQRVELLAKEMQHVDTAALAGWLRTTWLPYLERLPKERRETFVDEVLAAYLSVRPPDEHGRMTVDAVRIEVEGSRIQLIAAASP